MRLGWNRDEGGVITVFANSSDGRGAPIADFWVQPLIDNLGMSRAAAMEWQQQFAELLVNAHKAKAAAPQMLEALRRLTETVQTAIDAGLLVSVDGKRPDIMALERARAAIAAATGEEK